MMLPCFCHSPLKVVPILAASMKIIMKILVNYQNASLPDLSRKIRDKVKTISNKANARHEIKWPHNSERY